MMVGGEKYNYRIEFNLLNRDGNVNFYSSSNQLTTDEFEKNRMIDFKKSSAF